MGQQSKRMRAPAPHDAPPPAPLLVPLPAHLLVPPLAHLLVPPVPKSAPPPAHLLVPPSLKPAPSTSTWMPPRPQQSVAASLQQTSESAPMASCWAPPAYMADNMDYSDPQAWGVDSHPPGGYLSYFQNTPSPTQPAHNGSSPQPINVGDDTNGDCGRTEKRLLWTKQEDLRLVSAWLNNSNDPIQSNYKKNDQYWNDVAAVYNSTTPKNRERLVKQLKDRFARIKKRVAWFCASYKEANALYRSGESDADIKKRAMETYEEDHKKDGPFMFEHCWEILKKEPKWDAYLERLEDLEPDKRKFSVDDEVGKHSTIDDEDDDEDKRPPGGKQTKEKQKRKRKAEGCIIDLEDELQKFVDAQNAANEGRKEMLETQRRVSSENLEARKLAHLAAKDHKESVMLETYRSLMMQDTTGMPEDVRSEHVLALKCLREKLFGKTV